MGKIIFPHSFESKLDNTYFLLSLSTAQCASPAKAVSAESPPPNTSKISSLKAPPLQSASSDSDRIRTTMDTVLFDFLDSAVPRSTPKALSLPATQPTPSTLSCILQSLSETVKACLPRRVHEPTGPLMVLFDMLLSIFVAHGACKTAIQNLPVQVVGHSTSHHLVPIPVNEGDKCAICLGPYEQGDTVRHLACSHAFHTECVDTWLEKKSLCPVCKTDAC